MLLFSGRRIIKLNKKRGKILIVDDSMEQIDLLTEVLIEDYDTISAFNGMQAIELARKIPQPDLILLDIIIPAPDGYEVCSILQSDEKTADIPVILITGLSGNNNKTKGLSAGIAGYINKPFNIKNLKDQIERIIKN
jgi:CheY-like chemotaxis protein